MMTWTLKRHAISSVVISLTLLFGAVFNASANEATSDTAVLYYHHDYRGDPVVVTREDGRIQWIESYRAYGEAEPRVSSAGIGFGDNVDENSMTRQGYTGHEKDAASNLTYMKARHFDNLTGRFLNNDPVGFYSDRAVSFNRYAYAGNNPIRFVDPDGKDFLDAYLNYERATRVGKIGGRVTSRGARNPIAAGAGIVFTSSATLTGYGLHKLAVYWNAEDTGSQVDEDAGSGENNANEETALSDDDWKVNAPKQIEPGSDTEREHVKYNPRTKELEKSDVRYDEYGRQIGRTDHTDHGYPDNHTNPHEHEYEYSPGNNGRGTKINRQD